jgi:hypothetical protein
MYMPKVMRKYNYMLYCSEKCSLEGVDETTCDCGKPATQHPWVLQINSEDTYITTQLHVCDDCAQQLEGTSDTPFQIKTAEA